jgi:hypothetical protein
MYEISIGFIFQADLTQNFELSISLDNMTTSKDLVVPPGTLDYRVKLLLFDNQDRPLELTVRIKAGIGGSLKVSFLLEVSYCFTHNLISCSLLTY